MQPDKLRDMTDEELEAAYRARQARITLDFPDRTAKGAPRRTPDNYQALLDFYQIRIRHNEMTKETEIEIPGESFHADTEMNGKLAYIIGRCDYHELDTKNLYDYIQYQANQNAYHPVRDWIASREWDGQDRLQDFYATLTVDLTVHDNPLEFAQLQHTMMRKWALSAVAALYHPQFSCEGVLCLFGPQGLGKTTWVLSLLPPAGRRKWFKDGVTLVVGNKDSMIETLGFWITELGEIASTFKKTDIDQLKQFITKNSDHIRPPFARTSNKYARRTIMIGTMNEQHFLRDDENRRFWPVNVTAVRAAQFDVQQFWAQMADQYRNIAPLIEDQDSRLRHNEFGWFLSPAEREILNRVQTVFKASDPTEELLQYRLRPQADLTTEAEWMNCTQILRECGRSAPTRSELNQASKWLQRNNYGFSRRDKRYLVEVIPEVSGEFRF